MTYPATIKYLYSLQRSGIKLGLANIGKLLDRLDTPATPCPAVHIAGTSGKGSVAAMLEVILRRAGFRTGLYTSPHFTDFRERIRVNGRKIPSSSVVRIVSRLKPAITRLQATYFETVTALALCYFKESRVEIAVVEVGLGGRFDATNVITPLVSVITPIDYDHQEYLGTTLGQIAFEKAGIIKPGVPVVTGQQRPTARQVLKRACRKRNSPLVDSAGVKITGLRSCPGKGLKLAAVDLAGRRLSIRLPVMGEHQADNLRTVLAALNTLPGYQWPVTPAQIRQGLKGLELTGRVQVVRTRPQVVLDMAHNPSKIRALTSCLQKGFTYRKLIMVLGIMQDKDTRGIMKLVSGLKPLCIVTRPGTDRAETVGNLVRLAGRYKVKVKPLPRVGEAVRYALSVAGPADLVCVTGSIYTVGEALRIFFK